MFHLFFKGWTDAKHLPKEVFLHHQLPASHYIFDRGHAMEQSNVLKSARNTLLGYFIGLHRGALFSTKPHLSFLRVIEAVNYI